MEIYYEPIIDICLGCSKEAVIDGVCRDCGMMCDSPVFHIPQEYTTNHEPSQRIKRLERQLASMTDDESVIKRFFICYHSWNVDRERFPVKFVVNQLILLKEQIKPKYKLPLYKSLEEFFIEMGWKQRSTSCKRKKDGGIPTKRERHKNAVPGSANTRVRRPKKRDLDGPTDKQPLERNGNIVPECS